MLSPEVCEGKALFWGQSQVRQGGDWKPRLPWCHAVLRAPDKAREPPAQLLCASKYRCLPTMHMSVVSAVLLGKAAGCLFSVGDGELTLDGESFVPRSHEARVASPLALPL